MMNSTAQDSSTAPRQRFGQILEDRSSIDLVEAALVIAGEEYTDLDVEQERERIRAIGQEAARRVEGIDNPFARLDRLKDYLFDELAFHGNTDEYSDPRNSFLNEVLNRRVGIPLTLSIIFMEVASAAGFRCRGINLPGHFIVRIEFDQRTILVDPFSGGTVITLEDCAQLVARSTGRPSLFKPELLEGAEPAEIVARLLRNLKRTYLANEDYARALSVVDRLLMIFPDDPTEIRDRGILMSHLGDNDAAVADLEEYLNMAPEAPDADSVRNRLTHLRKKMTETS